MYTITAYIIYLSLSLLIVLKVGKILHKNGKDYLFGECNDQLAGDAVNNILYVGYCLTNTGFAFYFLDHCGTLKNFTEVIEFITASEGFILVSLGIMHFINMILAPKMITFFLRNTKQNINPPAAKASI